MIPLPILGFGKALIGSKPFLYALAGFLSLVGWNVWMHKHDDRVATTAVQKIDTQARTKATEAIKAREPAYQPGSAERLRARYCADCGAQK
jgi:hypothetical protein